MQARGWRAGPPLSSAACSPDLQKENENGIFNLHTILDTSDKGDGVVRGNRMNANECKQVDGPGIIVPQCQRLRGVYTTNYTNIEQLKISGLLSLNLTWYS